MIGKWIAAGAMAACVFSSTAAYADNGCNGCNVRDAGEFNDYLVNTTVYYDGNRGTAGNIDYNSGSVYITFDNGAYGWEPADEVYTEASQNERIGTGVVVGVGVAALLCAMTHCLDSSQNSSNDSSSYNDRDNRDNGYDQGSDDSRSSDENGSDDRGHTTPGFYGDCHGGTGYGCDPTPQ